MKLLRTTLVVCVATAFTGAAFGGPINIVSYASVGPNTSNFEDVTGSPFPGTVYNGVLTSGGVRYAERFAGQTLGFSGNNDVLSGSPSNPLTLQVGAANQNLDVGTDNGTNDLIPCGLLGCADPNGYGEGSFAALFPTLVSQVGFQSFFAENVGATTVVQFFGADGTLIDSLSVIATLTDSYGFARAGGIADIAGISVHTFDPGGLGYDNFRFDSSVNPAPEPGTFDLGGALLAGLGLLRLRRRNTLQR